MTVSLSIVIPVAPAEPELTNLLNDLSPLAGIKEIVIVTADSETDYNLPPAGTASIPQRVLVSPAGRARQMNRGAREAAGEFLWFLHADTVISPRAWNALQRSLRAHPQDLHYFDLSFDRESHAGMKLNAWGVWIRSHWFRMPFGDQGLCLSSKQFHELGGYEESLKFGEDHAFIWKARAAGMRIRPAGASVVTSARKYQRHGWLRTTLKHQWLTWKQAIPGYVRLLKKRWCS